MSASEFYSRLEALKEAKTRADVALLLGIKPSVLAYILFKKNKSENYQTFEIPKKSGGTRKIDAPIGGLKDLQRTLASVLSHCVQEMEIALNLPNTISHGFMPGRSIFTNAYPHRNKRFVFNVDLEDFFPSITFPRIRGFFIKDRSFQLNPDVATVLAQIACHEGRLPQGSPCSPIISNLLGQILDLHLVKIASKYGCIYSRYADDITFSTNKRVFPSAIARQDESHHWVPGRELLGVINKSDFSLNTSKTRMQYKDSRQVVTGLVTNKKINIRSEYRRDVRAKVHSLITTGGYFVKVPTLTGEESDSEKTVPGTLNQLHGRLGFIYTVDKFNWSLMDKHKSNYPEVSFPSKGRYVGNIGVYQQFLLYTLLYNNPRPLIVCEGKTDNVYLARAIHSLHEAVPNLVELNADGKRVLVPRIFKYPETSTGEVLGTSSGGASNLANLLRLYRDEVKKMTAPRGKSPVIFVTDNDQGPRQALFSTIKKVTKKNIDGTEEWVHLFENLYLVMTPRIDGSDSCMEDFFLKKDKEIIWNGKKFDPSSKADTANTYSKSTFAYKIVADRSDIDFILFRPLLDTISKVIKIHSESV